MPGNRMMVIRIRSTVIAHRQSTTVVTVMATNDVVHIVAHIAANDAAAAVRWLKIADALGGNDVRVIAGGQTHFHLPHGILGVDTSAGVRVCVTCHWVAAVKPCGIQVRWNRMGRVGG